MCLVEQQLLFLVVNILILNKLVMNVNTLNVETYMLFLLKTLIIKI